MGLAAASKDQSFGMPMDPELRLGSILLKRRYINSAQLRVALRLQVSEGIRLGDALLKLGYISERQLKRALRRQCWGRSIAAGIALMTSPVCPLLAHQLPGQNETLFKVHKLTAEELNSDNVIKDQALAINFSANGRFTLATSSLGNNSGLQFSLTASNLTSNSNEFYHPAIESGFKTTNSFNKQRIVPELSLFTTLDKPAKISTNFQPTRSDRYKNTIPAIIQLTLKGYCLMQVQGDQFDSWSFNKVENKEQRKYQLMFSVTKHF